MSDIGRNDPCPCGSGKKYKKCCEAKDQLKEHAVLEKQWTAAQKSMAKETADAETGDKAAPAAGMIPKKGDATKSTRPKHTPFMAPKSSMPRRMGGGG